MLRIVLVMLALVRVAHAGLDCEDEPSIRAIEKFAKSSAKHYAGDEYAWLCADFAAKRLAKRIEPACTKILDRTGDARCIELAALAGFGKLGTHDIFAAIAKRKEDALDYPGGFFWPRLTYLRAMADPRAVAVIVEQWRATEPRAAKRKSDNARTSWIMWRRDAAAVLAELGGKDELAFLEPQAKTKDKVVARACKSAMAAIEKRLATVSGTTRPTP